MPATDIRNSHGDLTVHALRAGRYENVQWFATANTIRDIRLIAHGEGFRVLDQHGVKVNVASEGVIDARVSLYFPQIKQARAEFRRRSRH